MDVMTIIIIEAGNFYYMDTLNSKTFPTFPQLVIFSTKKNPLKMRKNICCATQHALLYFA